MNVDFEAGREYEMIRNVLAESAERSLRMSKGDIPLESTYIFLREKVDRIKYLEETYHPQNDRRGDMIKESGRRALLKLEMLFGLEKTQEVIKKYRESKKD